MIDAAPAPLGPGAQEACEAELSRAWTRRLAIAVPACGLVFALAVSVDFAERFEAFAARHERWELDELLALFMILTVGLGVVAWRQFKELTREICTRAAAQRIVRRSEQTLNAIFEHSPAAIVVIDPSSGRILRANQAFATEIDGDLDHLVGRRLDALGLFSADFRAALLGDGPLTVKGAEERIGSGTARRRRSSAPPSAWSSTTGPPCSSRSTT
ncbi:MAG: PAS domain-containing protein [Vicinamibacterales bacterium]